MEPKYDAPQVLGSLVGKTIRTLTGRPNTVLGLEGDEVRVATTRSATRRAHRRQCGSGSLIAELCRIV